MTRGSDSMQKKRSTATASSDLHDLPEREGGQLQVAKRLVPVADFRQGYDRLWRAANVDYCACVNLDERKNWLAIAERILPDVEAMESKRANAFDHEEHRRSIERLRERMENVRQQILAANASPHTKH